MAEARSKAEFDDVRTHLAGECAVSAGVATRHLGRFRESAAWNLRAEESYGATETGRYFLPQVAFLKLCVAYNRHEPNQVLDRISAVIADLERVGPPEQLWRSRFLEAAALKDAGRFDESLSRFQELILGLESQSDHVLMSLALSNVAEVFAKCGNHGKAMACLQHSLELLKDSDVPWVIANVQSALGEVLRDQGRLAEAIVSYQAAVETYVDSRMDSNAAYIRIVLAETLLAAGRHEDAAAEILRALPVVERERLAP